MVKTVRAFFLSFTIVIFVLFSTIGTVVVRADGSTGTPVTDPTSTPADGQTSDPGVEVTPVTPTEETQPAVPPLPAEETVVVDPAPENILQQVPENTTVVVLNSDGETLSLASQASADVIASTYDPIWCPAGQSPTPGLNGCTSSFSSFDELLTFLQANEIDAAYQTAGTIYIQQGEYLGGESQIDFNNYTFNEINKYDLTLQGGWDTNTGTTTATTQFNVPIIIGSSSNPWVGSLTINNLSISDVTGQAGLTLFTQGNIDLSNVEVTNSQSGAALNATGDVTVADSNFNNNANAGATINAGGKAEITNTHFNNNGSGQIDDPTGSGVNIKSGGAVSLASVSANNNQLFGANIQAAGNVVVTNGFFNGNQGYAYVNGWVFNGYGLQVVTTGNITLEGVNANDNYLFGAHLDGVIVNVTNSSFSENSSDWNENPTGYGLEIKSTNDINLIGVTANNNQLFGANIESIDEVMIHDSFFNGNKSYTYSSTGEKSYGGYGLRVVTTDNVDLQRIEATGNNLYGAHIETSEVAIDTADFSNNSSGDALNLTGRGLEIVSDLDVMLIDVNASNNQLFGANIQAGDAVSITARTIDGVQNTSNFNGHLAYYYDYFHPENILNRDGGYGLRVVAGGLVSIEHVNANNNYLYGAYVQGDNTAVQFSSFTDNGSGLITSPTGFGLQVVSSGVVTLNDVDASRNQLFGADIAAVDYVVITNSIFSGHQSVTFTPGEGLTFYGYGLTVVTPNDIFLDFVTANFNNLWGGSLTGRNITVSNSHFNNNVSDSNIFIDDTGLLVNASGTVELYNVEAKENRLIGATITAAGNVTIADSNFTDNRGFTCSLNWCPEGSITYHGYGLQVTTPGLIQVTGTNVSNNNLFGASLNGALVTVENSTFNNNSMGNGLTINATDNVTLTNVTALNNGGNGVDVTGVCAKLVQATGGTFNDNDLFGISVVNATLTLDGTQIFVNNTAGNIFTDTSTCVVVTPIVLNSPTNNEPPAGQQQQTPPENTTGNNETNTPQNGTSNTPGSFNIVLPPSNFDGSKLVPTSNTQSFGKKTTIVTTNSSDRKYERTPDRKVQVKSKDVVKKYTHKLTLGQAGRGKR